MQIKVSDYFEFLFSLVLDQLLNFIKIEVILNRLHVENASVEYCNTIQLDDNKNINQCGGESQNSQKPNNKNTRLTVFKK